MIQSPLNYTGGKYKLLPQLLPLFPKDTDVFVDLFCGGCNVGINVAARRVVYNDSNSRLCRLYRTFRDHRGIRPVPGEPVRLRLLRLRQRQRPGFL